MRPEFRFLLPVRKRRGQDASNREVVSGRVDSDFKAELEIIAHEEGDGLNGLILEGLWRVAEDRRAMPNYKQWLEEGRQKMIDELEVEKLRLGDLDLGSPEGVTDKR